MVNALKRVIGRGQRQPERCHRCGGLMVSEKVFELGTFDWRCVSCGERVDPVILAHREAHRAKSLEPGEAGRLFVGHGTTRLN